MNEMEEGCLVTIDDVNAVFEMLENASMKTQDAEVIRVMIKQARLHITRSGSERPFVTRSV